MTVTEAVRLRPAGTRLASVVWLVAGVVYFVLEAVAATAFVPSYSYAHNYISDLGVDVPGELSGRPIDSPLAFVMNVNFAAHGLLFLIAAVLIVRTATGALRYLFLGLAAVHAVGMVMIATVHGSAQAIADGTFVVHSTGAALAIFGANAAIIVAGIGSRVDSARRSDSAP